MWLLSSGHPSVVNHDHGTVCFMVRKGDSFLLPQFLTSDPLRGTYVHVFLDDPIKATYCKHIRLSSTKHLARALRSSAAHRLLSLRTFC
jgi:hypothetical protein